ncbi:MAG: hypothetical protein KF789_12505 [Bdellovibrionaceae bacterium]|nr:hypothetical protein [Pseudobdellovibrionaceae bacterium]
MKATSTFASFAPLQKVFDSIYANENTDADIQPGKVVTYNVGTEENPIMASTEYIEWQPPSKVTLLFKRDILDFTETASFKEVPGVTMVKLEHQIQFKKPMTRLTQMFRGGSYKTNLEVTLRERQMTLNPKGGEPRPKVSVTIYGLPHWCYTILLGVLFFGLARLVYVG